MINHSKVLKFTLLILIQISLTSFHLIQAQADSDFASFFINANNYDDVEVIKVLSNDSFSIMNKQNKKENIHLIGLKSPKLPELNKKVVKMAYGEVVTREDPTSYDTVEEQSINFVHDLLDGQHVRLEFDHNKLSTDGETAAYVYLIKDGTFVNDEILRRGFAYLSIQPPNTKYEDILRAAYQEARKEYRGLHTLR